MCCPRVWCDVCDLVHLGRARKGVQALGGSHTDSARGGYPSQGVPFPSTGLCQSRVVDSNRVRTGVRRREAPQDVPRVCPTAPRLPPGRRSSPCLRTATPRRLGRARASSTRKGGYQEEWPYDTHGLWAYGTGSCGTEAKQHRERVRGGVAHGVLRERQGEDWVLASSHSTGSVQPSPLIPSTVLTFSTVGRFRCGRRAFR